MTVVYTQTLSSRINRMDMIKQNRIIFVGFIKKKKSCKSR